MISASPPEGLNRLPPLREVIAKYGLAADKRLGQHFLLDGNLTDRIARAAGDVSRGVTVEIGPGPGGLTRSLLRAGARVIAVERDPRCVQALAPLVEAAEGNLRVIEADALETDIAALAEGAPCRIAANLPYNIGTPLLIAWLKNIGAFKSLVLMFQREVADRITAAPKTKDYGRLSVMCQWLCECEKMFGVDKRAFTPPPSVASAVVRLTPRAVCEDVPWGAMERTVKAAFGQRRKMLRQSLRGLVTAEDLEAAGIDPARRAETLSIAEFAAAARLCGDGT
ncbi:MAG: 16S rRNA (adenine(1518)-N(6)/adenine(1519)-N(6))-dimethyltransferase RsmA [Rhodospirillales bacterium]